MECLETNPLLGFGRGALQTSRSAAPCPCRALRQRQQRYPVLFLSTGGTCWHADARRMSIAAAICWALESNLQGLVLDSGAVQEQSQAIATARSKGLKASQPSSIATALS